MEVVEVFVWVTTISTFLVQLMGIDICLKIYKKGSTGDISAFPFIANFTAASLWLRYGILQSLGMLILTNTFGVLLNFVYLMLFYYFTSKKIHFIRTIFINMTFIFSVLYYVKYQQIEIKQAASHLGKVCALLSILAYGAPLASLKVVMHTKTTECLSFPYIFMNFVVALEWVIYGRILNDIYVQLPNFLGFCLAVIQLALFCKYPSKSTSLDRTITVTA
ncbi:sugar transporter SWEET1-like [Mytilus galloprovincialis]|uniref:Sugar transporter SWEET1 n=1 Tax=Mytilus galloprovincialis TaxID=29158 RepID=A0A8B6GNY7_MYTGA|nr:solute carrier family 50 (sugar transporter) [Mytilus galloprovincialis]